MSTNYMGKLPCGVTFLDCDDEPILSHDVQGIFRLCPERFKLRTKSATSFLVPPGLKRSDGRICGTFPFGTIFRLYKQTCVVIVEILSQVLLPSNSIPSQSQSPILYSVCGFPLNPREPLFEQILYRGLLAVSEGHSQPRNSAHERFVPDIPPDTVSDTPTVVAGVQV
jgi:hypothetical protein